MSDVQPSTPNIPRAPRVKKLYCVLNPDAARTISWHATKKQATIARRELGMSRKASIGYIAIIYSLDGIAALLNTFDTPAVTRATAAKAREVKT